MATIYVSKSGGSDSNNGTSKSTAVATLPYAFQLAAGSDNTIEVIDSSTYVPSGTASPFLPGDNGSGQAWTNLTFKAGTNADGDQVYPVIDGRVNEHTSSSSRVGNGMQYQAGWTVEGFEIRGFSDAAATPASEGTLIFKNNIVHHITSREAGGSTSGVVEYSSGKGDETTNVVENCVFFEIGKYVIAGTNTEDVHIKNCLIANWGGTSGNNNAIKLNSTGSIVEHCIITDYEGGSTVKILDLTGKGEINYCIFNNITTGMGVINSATAQSNAFANISGVASASFSETADSAEHDQIYSANLTWNSSSTSAGYFDSIGIEEIGRLLNNSGYPAYAYTSNGSDGVDEASGSTLTGDLADQIHIRAANSYDSGRKRDSSAAGCSPDIGCFEFYTTWTEQSGCTNPTIGNDFVINDAHPDNMESQYSVKLNNQKCIGNPRPPFSKTIRGPANLRIPGNKSTIYRVERSKGKGGN
jgi:hypothetical protein